PLEVLKNNVDGVAALTNPIGVLVSNDGQNVYVANASSNRLSVFSRTSAGYLSLIDREVNTQEGVTNMFGPFDVAESPDGQYIYTANRDGNSVSVFGRNQNDGMLTFVETIVSCTSPYAVQVSRDADGSRVFVACWEGDAVQLFTRNRETGKLTFVQQLDEGGALSFQGAVGLVSSADDRSVYVAMWADSSANSQTSVRRLSAVPPQPLLTNISPASRDVGGAAFVLTVNGLRFEPQSVVLVNGQPLATEFVTSEQLKATAPASLLAAAGNLQVAVQTTNAQPSATSNAAPFAVTAPAAPDVPSIESLSPPAAPEGSQLLNVVVKGSNFLSNTRAFLNGGPVKTTFINGNTLLVELTAPDLALDGPLAISVQNVTPNAVAAQGSEPVNAAEAFAVVNSTAVRFSTAPLGTPAPPAISGFEPTSVVAGSGAQAVVVKGYNFVGGDDGTVALWKGSPRPTQVVDANTLLMELTAQDLAAAQSAAVSAQTAGQPTSLPLALLVRAPGSNPLPTIQGALVDPAGGFFILVTGSDFVPASIVRLNAVDQPTS
ncbi:MAG: lactonase family protein, partial [Caldilineaceae bacterium]